MTRRPALVLAVVVLLGAASAGAIVLTRDRGGAATVPPTEGHAEGLTLLVARTPGGPFGVVIGSTGAEDGALVIPSQARVTIPGQGDGTVEDAFDLPPEQAAITVANLLGVGIDHQAVLTRDRLVAVVDRAGGIVVGSDRLSGEQAAGMLADAGDGGTTAFQLVVTGLLQSTVVWQPDDFAKSDSAEDVRRALTAAGGAQVASLPVTEAATNVFQADPETVRRALVDVFGGPDRVVVDVIVLNGSGVPGIGELVADRIVPGGFRIVVSQNAANFNHDETLVVVGSADDVALGERVRDLLGTGSVNVSVASGIAPVTIVVGKDFAG